MDSFKSSKAAVTAAMTNAEKVQSLPWMASSTCCTTLDGNRIVLLTVGGVEGILKFAIPVTSQCKCIANSVKYRKLKICIAIAMHISYTMWGGICNG